MLDWDNILIALEKDQWDGRSGLLSALMTLPSAMNDLDTPKPGRLCADLLDFTFTDWYTSDKIMTEPQKEKAEKRGNPDWLTKEGHLHYVIEASGTSGSITVPLSRYKGFTNVAQPGIKLSALADAYAGNAGRGLGLHLGGRGNRSCTCFFERLATDGMDYEVAQIKAAQAREDLR